MGEYQNMCYEYEGKAFEEVKKANPDSGYYPYLQKALEYAKEATKYAELELEDSGFQIITDNFFLYNALDYAGELSNTLDMRELREYSSYEEAEMYKVNLKYRKDIVDLFAYASSIYEKYFPGTEDELYTKHLLMYYITVACNNYCVYISPGKFEYIGLNAIEKRPYLELFDKLTYEGIHKMNFPDRFMYFHNNLNLERENVDEFRANTAAHQNQAQQSSNGGCYIATAVYGSYDCPEVWTLRRFRDEWLSARFLGKVFINLYYRISPTVVRLFGKKKAFNSFWRTLLDRFTIYLNKKGYSSDKYTDK